ncbi:pilus assembly protein PilW [Massilia arenosa]|uniref:Pilus assembly protein PilW n=1 Tax=Zemynaea arenosa TaxID=2561931 RepID=A0A4Y9SDL5_9BURK|nr:PilW family protein [Massilia arenosa]TFW17868.1 pilus assembly protein PilW [Massilia arenosa]
MRPVPLTRPAPGFSLIELMVSILIGMIALIFATRMVTGTDEARQSALGGSDQMQNGMLAMFSISNDAAQAGWGLNDPLLVGCDTVMSDTGHYALPEVARGTGTVHPLAAAIIENNGTRPDRITLLAGSSMSGTGTMRIIANYSTGTRIDVDRVPYGFNQGDVIVAAPETAGAAQCALAQISNDTSALAPPPADQYVNIASGTSFRFNSGALGAAYSGSQARLFNLGPAGGLAFHTWSVANGLLQLRSTDLAGASAAPSTVVDNVVSIKAQYGFDTRLGAAFQPQTGLTVQRWSNTMIDADGDTVVGSAGDYQHVAALRIAVVARSRAPEKPAADGTCSATSTKPHIFATDAPDGVTAVPVDVDVDVTGDTLSWKCYRYRVFETIVPLRNAAWRPTA